MDVEAHLSDKALKKRYVATMFDLIAPGYDAFTRLFSFGMDSGWKSLLVSEGAKRAPGGAVLVDLACGTGDIGSQFVRHGSPRLVLGLDQSPSMLVEARHRICREGSDMSLVACDMLDLCLRENSVDLISIGYGLRNAADASKTLQEVARVLRPNGLLLNLDFYRPVGKVWCKLFLWYLWQAGRIAGWLWHREPAAYGYLAPSIRHYFTIPEFERELSRAGFDLQWRASRLGGAIGLHVAKRAGQQAHQAASIAQT